MLQLPAIHNPMQLKAALRLKDAQREFLRAEERLQRQPDNSHILAEYQKASRNLAEARDWARLLFQRGFA